MSEGEAAPLWSRLAERLGERFTRNETIRGHHGTDESWHPPMPPQAVVFPESTREVAEIVRACAEARIPIIPYGAGSALEGGVLAPRGGVSLDLTRMNRILEVRPEDLDVTLEAGVTRLQLERRLADEGLFFPVDPGADATLGGMAATRASGTNAVRYGTMRENVLALEVVLADGTVIETSRKVKKTSAGYDLTRLFVGSEGTLGVITGLTLRLAGLPEHLRFGVASFPDLQAAVDTAIETIQTGVPVARVELVDQLQMEAARQYSKLDLPAAPTLFFEVHGSEGAVEDAVREIDEITRRHEAQPVTWGSSLADRDRLWAARHESYYASLSLRPGSRGWTTDVCVPLSRLTECILETQDDLAEVGQIAPMVGHVGDGNFHLVMLIDPDSDEEIERAHAVHQRLVARAHRLGGTCTGEHGVGIGKAEFLEAEHGPALDVMRTIKKALDPQGLMNPGKLFPEDVAAWSSHG